MLQCLSLKSSSSPPSTSSPAAAAAAATPAINSPPPPRRSQGGGTSSEASPSAALTNEYTLAVQSNSCNEIWSRIHEVQDHRHHDEGDLGLEEDEEENREQRHQRVLLGQVLQPNRECVEEALRHARPNALTGLASDYFEQSEMTAQVCLVLLHRSVYLARQLYAPLHQLLDVLAPLSLSQSQCSRALDLFLEFDRQANPFPSPDDPSSHKFDDMRRGFSQLKDQLDRRLRSSRSRIRFLRRATIASTLCLVGTAVGVAVAAVAITAHALTAAVVVVAGPPFCCTTTRTSTSTGTPGGTSSSLLCSCMTATEKEEVAHVKQLDAAAKGTCVLNNDLATIDRLVRRLHTAVEGDKLLVRLGLERGNPTGSGTAFDKHPIQEVLKQLGKSHPNFLQLLDELEEHIYLCFSTVNRARSLLLHHISTLQSTDNVN